MQDVLWTAVTVAFFVGFYAYHFFNDGNKKYLLDAEKPSIYFRPLTKVD